MCNLQKQNGATRVRLPPPPPTYPVQIKHLAVSSSQNCGFSSFCAETVGKTVSNECNRDFSPTTPRPGSKALCKLEILVRQLYAKLLAECRNIFVILLR